MFFVDTNVLVYNRDATDPPRQQRCAAWLTALWEARSGRTGVQVLNEYYCVMTTRFAGVFPVGRIRDDVRRLDSWAPVAVSRALIDDAWRLADDYSLSWWDSLVVAAARQANCDRLLTEDLADGADLGGVVVTSPFTSAPPAS